MFQLVIFCSLVACQTSPAPRAVGNQPQPPLLNSERIRQKFGNYGIDVLEADKRVRVSNLYSLNEGEKVTRTLAIVIFPASIPDAILPEHKLIIAGGSIGEVFKNSGWQVEKESLYLGELQASPNYAGVYEMMGKIPISDLAVHEYELSVSTENGKIFYTTIVEVHNPEYLRLHELETIYFVDGTEHKTLEAFSLSTWEIVRDSLSGL